MKLKLPSFDDVRILVAGDLMLDRYWHGSTARISPEAPVPVVHVGGSESRPGGAGNVAVNVTALGAQATLSGVTGRDENGLDLVRLLSAAGVESRFLRHDTGPTVTKLRVISRRQQLLRLDFEDGFAGVSAVDLVPYLESRFTDARVLVLSDYAKGALQEPWGLIDAARQAGLAVLVDPKGTDFGIYRGATLLTPNLGELEAVVGRCESDAELEERGLQLARDCALEALLITRGEDGMSLLRPGRDTLHLPARAREVFDVTGAGDTVIATLAASLGAGLELPQAVALANIAAGIVVGKLGTATVSVAELRRALHEHEGGGHGVMTEDELLHAVADARAHGERVVMTNGCFDLLHAGHVAYLEQARDRGDRLLVAVNDDDSVRRLKGEGRPVTPLEDRMSVLAGLAAVDWVVPFSEDTPERIIGRVLPDVLVKGGDYSPESMVGYNTVTAHGGRVEVLDFIEGCSTTRIIEKLRSRD
jgi:D-beta-D-heptose 7-phosphate kinase / D-beta-D-heptose 1-phosphate adenosyltransferase